MSFYDDLGSIILACKQYQKEVDDKELWFQEPCQTRYLYINELLKVYEENRVQIENVAAAMADENTPGFLDLSSSRKDYYELEKIVPPFLAGDHHHYYYLQTYYIACLKLLKDFSYTTFRGDFPKMYKLREWFAFINGAQEKHDTDGSIQTSISDIKKMGNFENLAPLELQQLQAEVHNIQTLLIENPEAIEGMSAEDTELLNQAALYIKQNEHKLEELPPIDNSFEFYEAPFLETAAYRCRQLIVQADNFPDQFEKAQKVKELYEFKDQLKDSFDMTIPICADIYTTIVQIIGSHQQPSIKKLCKMIHQSLEPFVDEKELHKRYPNVEDIYTGGDIELGMPDTSILFDLLMVSLG